MFCFNFSLKFNFLFLFLFLLLFSGLLWPQPQATRLSDDHGEDFDFRFFQKLVCIIHVRIMRTQINPRILLTSREMACVFAQKISEIFQKYCLNFSTESIQYFCNNVGIFTTNCKYIAGLYTSLRLSFKHPPQAVSASRLVKSSDSYARETRSRLGGSSWLCNEKKSLQSSMKSRPVRNVASKQPSENRGRLTMKRNRGGVGSPPW